MSCEGQTQLIGFVFLLLLSVLRFFLEYQWLVDFAVYATGVFLFTECYYSVMDASKEVNIGAIWCVLTVLFSLYPSAVKSPIIKTLWLKISTAWVNAAFLPGSFHLTHNP